MPGYPPAPLPLGAEDLLARAEELGVGVVQFADNLPLDRFSETELDALRARARQRGLELEVGTRGCRPERLRESIAAAQRLESGLLRVVLDQEGDEPSPEEVTARLQAVVPELESAGLTLAIENHDRFPAATLLGILGGIGSERVGICLDTANSFGCLEGPDAVMDVLGPRVVNLHIKDFVVRRVPHQMGFLIEGRPAGQGQLDIPSILSRLREMGRDPNVILELWPPPESTVAAAVEKETAWAKESIRYLRPLVEEED